MPPLRVPAGAHWEGIDLTSLSAPRKASVALLIGAFALSACGGNPPSPAASAARGASPAASVAGSTPPSSSAPSADATAAPSAGGSAVDPADDLEIAAPYALAPLNEQATALFNAFIEQSSASVGDVFDVGYRAVTKDGGAQPVAVVIVMSFTGLPVTAEALLDGVAQGSAGAGGSVESQTIGGAPVRIVEAETQTIVMTVVGDELVMAIATSRTKKDSVDVATAVIEAN
jgi:hypothetical protein